MTWNCKKYWKVPCIWRTTSFPINLSVRNLYRIVTWNWRTTWRVAPCCSCWTWCLGRRFWARTTRGSARRRTSASPCVGAWASECWSGLCAKKNWIKQLNKKKKCIWIKKVNKKKWIWMKKSLNKKILVSKKKRKSNEEKKIHREWWAKKLSWVKKNDDNNRKLYFCRKNRFLYLVK